MDPLLREIPLLWRAAVLLVWRRALRLRWNIKRYERRRVGGRPVLGPLQATSIAVVIEDEEADCGPPFLCPLSASSECDAHRKFGK